MPQASPVPSSTQFSWIFYRQRAQHDGVHEREDGGVGADAEGEREQCHEGDAGRAQHGAETVKDVLREGFEPVPSPCGVALLAQQCGIAEAAACGCSGIVGRYSCIYMLLSAQVEMQLHLFGKLAGGLLPMGEHANAARKFFEPIHLPAPIHISRRPWDRRVRRASPGDIRQALRSAA